MRPDFRRLSSVLVGAALAITALWAPATAQEGTAPPDPSEVPAACAVLTVDEVSAALGEPLTLTGGDGSSCQFDGDYDSGRFMSLFTSVAEDTTIDDIVTFLCPSGTPTPEESPDASTEPCGAEVTVGDSVGAYIPEGFGTMLYIDIGDGDLLAIQLVGDPLDGVDKLEALTQLGALVLPRMAALPQPTETQAPAGPSFTPDRELEALFPSEIGGQTLDVTSFHGADAFADTELPEAVLDALAAQGKTLDDVSVATGYSFDANTQDLVMITALQVKGADMATMEDAVIQGLIGDEAPAEQTQSQLGGKDVTIVRPNADSTDDELQYVYPMGDVLWMVSATEPALSEVFSKLP